MSKLSAGLLLYRWRGGQPEVFLVHPGGPFWRNKDIGGWSIPKGEFTEGEEPLEAARRELFEETGLAAPGPFAPLTPRKQPSGKTVYAWAVEHDCDPATIKSNVFVTEWPPRSGRMQEFPEVDRAAWFDPGSAKEKIHKGQAGFIDELEDRLRRQGESRLP